MSSDLPQITHDTALSVGAHNENPRALTFRELVREDFDTHGRDWASQGFWVLFWHRFGNWRMDLPKPLRMPATVLYRVMRKLGQWVCGIDMPYPIRIGRRLRIEHFGTIILSARSIGDDVVIRQNTTMGVSHGHRPTERPIIGNRVDIGAGAVIIGPITIGDDAVIGANAVVIRDVPAGATVGGVPARILKQSTVVPLASAAE